jgi:hypothetical protein
MTSLRLDWNGRKDFPRWFVTRGANFVSMHLGVVILTIPWVWHPGALESRGYDSGWRAGYQAGLESADKR